MSKYRQKPVVVEAMEFKGSKAELYAVYRWVASNLAPDGSVEFCPPTYAHDCRMEITTPGSFHHVSPGDYVIRDARGVYPCRPEAFEATYEPVNAEDEDEDEDEAYFPRRLTSRDRQVLCMCHESGPATEHGQGEKCPCKAAEDPSEHAHVWTTSWVAISGARVHACKVPRCTAKWAEGGPGATPKLGD